MLYYLVLVTLLYANFQGPLSILSVIEKAALQTYNYHSYE